MPQDSTHPDYDQNLPVWRKCRDFDAGGVSVKRAGDVYLPDFFRADGDGRKQYDAYKNRALFYNATGRTLAGLIGAAMRKPPDVKLPAVLQDFADNMLWTGVDLPGVSSRILGEVLLAGRHGLLLDRPADQGPLRLCLYPAESIINWGEDDDGIVNWVMLKETGYRRDPEDMYEWQEYCRYRELGFDPQTGVYVVKIHEKVQGPDGKEAWITTMSVPTNRQRPLDFLPFVLMTPNGEQTDIEPPPILDLAEVNHSHYLTSADLEHGRHFTGLPTPWISGLAKDQLDGGAITIGSTRAFVMEPPEAKCGYLEFTGAGLTSLENALASKEAMMAQLGARLLGAAPKQAETATAAQIRAAGETNILVQAVNATGRALTRILEMAAIWENATGSVMIGMNTDFVDIDLPAQEMTALVQAYQAGAMSLPTLLWNFKQGERIAPTITVEDEIALIEAGPPMDDGGEDEREDDEDDEGPEDEGEDEDEAA